MTTARLLRTLVDVLALVAGLYFLHRYRSKRSSGRSRESIDPASNVGRSPAWQGPQDDAGRSQDKTSFKCVSCGAEIVVKYLKPGEQAKCRACGAMNDVPESQGQSGQAT